MPGTKSLLRQQIELLGLMYWSYAISMMLKISVVFISPAMIDDPHIGMTKTEFGTIMAAGSLGGVLGKFFFGWLADKIGGQKAFLLSLFMISSGIILFGLSNHIIVFTITYFAVNFSKSAGWASMAKLIENWYRPSQYGRVWGVISTSSRTGAILASLMLGSLLYVLSWQETLWFAGAIGGVTFLLWLFFAREKPDKKITEYTTEDDSDSNTAESSNTVNPNQDQNKDQVENSNPNSDASTDPDLDHHLYHATIQEALVYFFKSKRVWLILVSMFGLTIQADFLNFVPILAKETLDLSPAGASMATSAFPIGAFISLLLGGYVYDKISSRAVTKAMGALLLVATVCLVVMLLLTFSNYTETLKVTIFCISLFTFGFTVAPAYYLPMSIFSIKFGKKYSGTLISILDSGGFAASMIFAIVAGVIADQAYGWSKVLGLLTVITLMTMVVLVYFLHGESEIEQVEKSAKH